MLSGILAAGLYSSIRTFILRASDSFGKAMKFYPLLIFVAVMLNTFFIISKGLKKKVARRRPTRLASSARLMRTATPRARSSLWRAAATQSVCQTFPHALAHRCGDAFARSRRSPTLGVPSLLRRLHSACRRRSRSASPSCASRSSTTSRTASRSACRRPPPRPPARAPTSRTRKTSCRPRRSPNRPPT